MLSTCSTSIILGVTLHKYKFSLSVKEALFSYYTIILSITGVDLSKILGGQSKILGETVGKSDKSIGISQFKLNYPWGNTKQISGYQRAELEMGQLEVFTPASVTDVKAWVLVAINSANRPSNELLLQSNALKKCTKGKSHESNQFLQTFLVIRGVNPGVDGVVLEQGVVGWSQNIIVS